MAQLSKPLQAADDMVRIISNGITFGGADRFAAYMGEKDTAARTAAARQRAGIAGDLADVASMFTGGKAAIKAVTKIPAAVRAVRALPEFAPALAQRARVALTNLGGPGLTRAEVASRLGIPYVPTLAERALKGTGQAIGKVVAYPFQHPVVSGLAGLAALGEYAGRSNATSASAPVSAQPMTAGATPVAQTAYGYDAANPEILAASREAASVQQNPEFSQLASMLARGNGGKVSLRELGALSDIAYKTVPRRSIKSPTIADVAGQRALDLGEQLAQTRMAQAAAAGDKAAYASAAQEQLDRYERLARARAIDPLSAYAYGMPEDDGN